MEEIKWMVDINLMGTFHLIKAALPAMKARTRETRLPGSIAIMSSQAGQVDDVHPDSSVLRPPCS
jgi:3-dehydrosphinganine reductase